MALFDLKAIITKKIEDPRKWQLIAQEVYVAWCRAVDALSVPARFKAAYKRCLFIGGSDRKHAVVVFDTGRNPSKFDRMLARAVERGVRPGGIDMKPGLLKGKAFVNVPLHHTGADISSYTPTAAGRSIAHIKRQMGTMEHGDRTNRGMVEKIRSRGMHLPAPEHAAMKQQIAQGVRKTMPRYAHATDPLADAIRQSESNVAHAKAVGAKKVGRVGGIVTFRRISQNSDPRSWHWMRKGMRGHHLAKRMRREAKTIAARILSS